MGDDVKKVSENCPVDSSSLLTDWLFKYKLDNISYLSSSQSHNAHLIKSSRKGVFDSRDIIRPTVQLFKSIRSKNKRGNETPSPQRNKTKATTIPSPTKESNRIFNHKGKGEDALDNYRKIYTYGKLKQDKVSRDKIESAVTLYRQREQEKENSANRSTPEKNKRVENREAISYVAKSRKAIIKTNKPNTKEDSKKVKVTSKAEEKQQKEIHDFKSNNATKEWEKKVSSGDSKKNEDSGRNEVNKKFKQAPTCRAGLKERKNIKKTKENNQKDNFTEENNQVNICFNDSTELKLDKESQCFKAVQKLNRLNSENPTGRNQIDVISVINDLEIDNQSRASLIRSLKSKCGQQEINKITTEVLSKRKLSSLQVDNSTINILGNETILTTDYMIVKPAFINNEIINVQAGTKGKVKKSVDDLLREYRIKYRNMIKLR